MKSCLSFIAMFMVGAAALLHATPPPAAKPLATLESVKVTSTPGGITVVIEASQSVAVRTQVISDPDRLIMDFPNSQPAGDLRTKLLNQGDVKGFRVARYSANPPTTRVVIDLNRPQHYQIFPDGKTVIVNLMSDQQQAAAQAHVDNVSFTPAPAKPAFNLNVEFKNGKLSVVADHVSLAQILNEVHRLTGTDITIPPGAAQEQIIVGIPPLPLREALVSLLNGSRFNFIMVDSEQRARKTEKRHPHLSRCRRHIATRHRHSRTPGRRHPTRARTATHAAGPATRHATPAPGRRRPARTAGRSPAAIGYANLWIMEDGRPARLV